mmetsp:Transcript_21805/g.63760  ORF Transcript_21805/g.63760 Transcript_21805/m.63760 type:complete len:122 (-) Transcript_21805:308-673(-)
MLFASARPFVLRYRSPQVRWLGNLFFMLPLVLGLLEEKQTHCAPLADELHNRRDHPVLEMRVALSSCSLQEGEPPASREAGRQGRGRREGARLGRGLAARAGCEGRGREGCGCGGLSAARG